MQGRTGITSSGKSSNRREEHLAVALYNACRPDGEFRLPDGRSLRIIDYQTPLKARRGDRGIGKVDLFGIVDGRFPSVVELKVAGKVARGDTPLRAVLEGMAYCAIIEANVTAIAAEAADLHGLSLSTSRPTLLVLAPEDYWDGYLDHPRAGDWLPAMCALASGLWGALRLEVHLLALRGPSPMFQMGLNGQPAWLTGECQIKSLDELQPSS